MKNNSILIYEDNVDKDIIRDDILAEVYEKLNHMNTDEIINIRNKIFNDEGEQILLNHNVKKIENNNDLMTVLKANSIIVKRYIDILNNNINIRFSKKETSIEHLLKMCKIIIDKEKRWTEDKSSRWLGYIQGVMATYDLIDVNKERDFTRELFHKAYLDNNIDIPESETI